MAAAARLVLAPGAGTAACPRIAPRARIGASDPRPGEARLEDGAGLEALLAAANAGDGRAFARFLGLVAPMLRGLIRARAAGLSAEEQEDVLQEVLLAIHLKRRTWRPDLPVRPWLYAVARHKVIDAQRRGRGRAAPHLPIEDLADRLAEDRAEVPLAARDADRMLARIDGRSAALVRAVAIEGETAETAGARVGLSAGAARVALHRALRRLAVILKGGAE